MRRQAGVRVEAAYSWLESLVAAGQWRLREFLTPRSNRQFETRTSKAGVSTSQIRPIDLLQKKAHLKKVSAERRSRGDDFWWPMTISERLKLAHPAQRGVLVRQRAI